MPPRMRGKIPQVQAVYPLVTLPQAGSGIARSSPPDGSAPEVAKVARARLLEPIQLDAFFAAVQPVVAGATAVRCCCPQSMCSAGWRGSIQ